jgi:hypothetical protein
MIVPVVTDGCELPPIDDPVDTVEPVVVELGEGVD